MLTPIVVIKIFLYFLELSRGIVSRIYFIFYCNDTGVNIQKFDEFSMQIFNQLEIMFQIFFVSEKYTFLVIAKFLANMCTWVRVIASHIFLILVTSSNNHLRFMQTQSRPRKNKILPIQYTLIYSKQEVP